MKRIDCRGLACPQPVMETKKALEEQDAGEVVVLLDNAGSKENVRRFAESQGCRVSVAEEKGTFFLTVQRGGLNRSEKAETKQDQVVTDLAIFIDSDSLGRGSEELGKILMRSFLQTLEQSETNLKKIIFMNNGVKLACAGSEVLEDLLELNAKGVEILCCGTCLDYFGIKKDLQVGKVSNMYEILTSLIQAGKVIKV